MKRLRLIKPWDLRIVRQKLHDGLRSFQTEAVKGIPAHGPSGKSFAGIRTDIFCLRASVEYCSTFINASPRRGTIELSSNLKTIR